VTEREFIISRWSPAEVLDSIGLGGEPSEIRVENAIAILAMKHPATVDKKAERLAWWRMMDGHLRKSR
jgi:hypothetical protein